MQMKWLKALLCVVVLGTFTACSDDDNNNFSVDPDPLTSSPGAYILNTGGWGANNSSLQYYSFSDSTISSDLFAAQNGYGMGDLAEDMVEYGSKIYVTLNNSAKVEVLDRSGKVIQTIYPTNDAGEAVKPCYLEAYAGAVYFTNYGGMVSRIDTTSLTITGSVAVGDHPEGLAAANGKLYANISGYGSGTKVAVVDVTSFTKTKELDVLLNPYTQSIAADDGYVYFVSSGNYAGSPSLTEAQYVYSTLQRIDPSTDVVTSIANASLIANRGTKMYCIYSEYYLPARYSIFELDLVTGEKTELTEIMEKVPSASTIDVNPSNGDIYVANTSYSAPNTMYVFNSDGTFKTSFQCGYYTAGAFFTNR